MPGAPFSPTGWPTRLFTLLALPSAPHHHRWMETVRYMMKTPWSLMLKWNFAIWKKGQNWSLWWPRWVEGRSFSCAGEIGAEGRSLDGKILAAHDSVPAREKGQAWSGLLLAVSQFSLGRCPASQPGLEGLALCPMWLAGEWLCPRSLTSSYKSRYGWIAKILVIRILLGRHNSTPATV